MTKPRSPGTEHHAIYQSFVALGGPDAAGEFIGKPGSYLYDCADPLRNSRLKVDEAIRLEFAAVSQGGRGYFAEMFLATGERARNSDSDCSPLQAFLNASGAWGKLCTDLDAAIHPDSEEGKRFSTSEVEQLIGRLSDMRHLADRFERTLLAELDRRRSRR
ncbi:hypothetical protein ACFOGJ_08980 [Marinibaculum pumilum]|uniref:Uncharacterized protein n=1 Tax=Marinibaculum pumilum TaxID=1766165 RepID=A0ABV7KZ05_9PROT